ncbi:protein of unknown function [Taphrina deformans PYCC 5710]|uniref:CBF1-interacting co-repressor CIR N-terminal domain-containing protein n=1 Tax=Taphrina deformans (strain PYCC 5710 / ATCC 11124 / CBS 356.35 / IMI 108563 / JCM 9778 / NBRC 8474) TaxID=1097556 RepID=R4XCN3_TAPDE|nr:protein of unknown function [Taphrina deformans PYCC 5710]|eukprot:CCG82136.1 protein of unknown function [Taphrina deformans PYCC 5710]
MPIKLLQHKSWHVYSRDNIERVKQDEAKEEARLKAQDVQALQAQADRRLASLRTGAPEDSPVDVILPQENPHKTLSHHSRGLCGMFKKEKTRLKELEPSKK